MEKFINYYKSLDLNKRINLKGVGAMLNPWLHGEKCAYLGEIKAIQHLDISFAKILLSNEQNWTGCGKRIFFTINWNSPIRPAFEIISKTCKRHEKKYHSMYPANSFDYLNIGTCNH